MNDVDRLIAVDIRTQTPTEESLGENIWNFRGTPQLPIVASGEIWHIGWDIPTRWAVDSDDQWWMDNGHGHALTRCDKKVVETERMSGFTKEGYRLQ